MFCKQEICYRQEDGSTIKVVTEQGATSPYYVLADKTIVTEAPEGFSNETRVECCGPCVGESPASPALPDGERKCGDTFEVTEEDGSKWMKPIKPEGQMIKDVVLVVHNQVAGAAMDALIGTVLVDFQQTQNGFVDHNECYPMNNVDKDLRLGAWKVRLGTPADLIIIKAANNGGDNHGTMNFPTLNYSGYNSTTWSLSSYGVLQASVNEWIAAGVPSVTNYTVTLTAFRYNPHPFNLIAGGSHIGYKTRTQECEGVEA